MTETRRDAPIPAESAEEARPWRLPFWTESPTHVVEREKEEAAESEAEDDEADAVEPNYPTADELETIRREAYNDGLEQGLVEGRQQGYKDGHDAGFAEGREAGHQEGFASGQKEGASVGFQEGKSQGAQEVAEEAQRLRQIVTTLQGSLRERDGQLPEVLVMLLTRLAEQVLEQELKTGATNIARYVDAAIDALPAGEALAKVYVSTLDAELLSAHKEAGCIEIDKALDAGECRIHSENSLVEYSVSDSLQQHLISLAGTLLTAADGYPSTDHGEDILLSSESETDDSETADLEPISQSSQSSSSLSSSPASPSFTSPTIDHETEADLPEISAATSELDSVTDSEPASKSEIESEPETELEPEVASEIKPESATEPETTEETASTSDSVDETPPSEQENDDDPQ